MPPRGRLRRWAPDTEPTRTLQLLVEDRRHRVDQKTAPLNRLTARLKMDDPQVWSWFRALDSPAVLAFLQRWPTLEAAQPATPRKLREFFERHDGGEAEPIEPRVQPIRQALPATLDPAVIGSSARLVQVTVQPLTGLRQAIQDEEKEMEQCTRTHPDFAIFDSLPGAGQALTPRLLVACGTRRDRFASAADISELPRDGPGGRAQWPPAVDSLAVGLPPVPAPDLPRMGQPDPLPLGLGPRPL